VILQSKASAFVVEERPNPSTDFYIRPWLAIQKIEPDVRGFDDVPGQAELDAAVVIFVRYIPPAWKQAVTANRKRIQAIYFFMDDELFEWSSFSNMPLRYRIKLYRYAWRHQHWLQSMNAKLLVSTHYLVDKYSHWQPELLNPQPQNPISRSPTVLFYHGSGSHRDELEWLMPVVEAVLRRCQHLVFEVIGDRSVNRLFSGLPRVQVLHPMQWLTYQAQLDRPGRSIGLAPLLDTCFNRARSHTKFYDITQAGAAGIYAEGPVYERIVEHKVNGVVLPMQPDKWAQAIIDLYENPSQVSEIAANASALLASLELDEIVHDYDQ
jgi:glycosyltransferase involved in cell wall biosynthesis